MHCCCSLLLFSVVAPVCCVLAYIDIIFIGFWGKHAVKYVGAGSHSLGLERLVWPVRVHLGGEHAVKVFLKVNMVYDHKCFVLDLDLDIAPELGAFHPSFDTCKL